MPRGAKGKLAGMKNKRKENRRKESIEKKNGVLLAKDAICVP
jgi:hypothetical protein